MYLKSKFLLILVTGGCTWFSCWLHVLLWGKPCW